VIIGGVAAGPKTAATLARRLKGASITLFQKEEMISYATCGMPYFASGDIDTFGKLNETSYEVPRDVDFFRKTKGFEVVTGAEVTAIDREKKTVTVRLHSSGETIEHGYGKLIIATGSDANKPPFPVAESPLISQFKRPEDAIAFRKAAQQGQVGKTVIVGAGLIGCELAEACTAMWGIETVLVEREKQLLPYVLDPDMSAIAEREVRRQDVELRLGAEVSEIKLDDDGSPVVILSGGESISADYVFLCLGVHPVTALAKDAGLAIGDTGGISVNTRMQTSDPDIYAGGDCVESYNLITGKSIYMPMGSLANRHGRVIAENLAGNDCEFRGVVGAFLVKIFDLNVGAVGLSQGVAETAGIKAVSVWGSFPDKPDYYPEFSTMSLKMTYDPEGGRLLGLQAVGRGDICRRVDVFSSFLQRNGTLEDLLDFEQGYAPPYSEALDPLHHLASVTAARKRGCVFISPNSDHPRDAIYLDVREPEEVSSEPWPSSEGIELLNIPLNDLRDRIGELDSGRKICIVCRRGPRSYQAAVILQQAGFDNVVLIGGGTQAALS